MKRSAYSGRRLAATVILWVALSAVLASVSAFTGNVLAPRGIPHDWSHRHLIFSRPRTAAIARRLELEPRYRMQQDWRRRQALIGSTEAYMQSLDARALQLAAAPMSSKSPPGWQKRRFPKPTPTPVGQLQGDWSVNLGSSANVGARSYPAKFSFTGAPNCTNDFVVFNTGVAGVTGGQASLVAYNNLYASTCSSSVPAVYWAYNTGGRILNSVVLSADGSQIAFVHTPSSGVASLVILKWKAHDGTSATASVTPQTITTDPGTYVTCKGTTNSCELTLVFGTAPTDPFAQNDSRSAPFYDYKNDVIYVGDDYGYLHKFTGVFNGSPQQVISSGWPAVVHTGWMLNSPVLDSNASPPLVFVTEFNNNGGPIGTLDSVNASSGGTGSRSAVVGYNTSADIGYAPIVDSSAGKIYVAVARDHLGNSGVFQFDRSSLSSNTEVSIGTGDSNSITIPVYNGDFDNAYYNSSNATGKLYICGDAGGNPTLYQVPINAAVLGPSSKAGPALASANVGCSPVTEIYNPNASGGPFDWIFLSVPNSGSPGACGSSGCIMNFIVTAWQPNNAYATGQEVLDSNLNIEKVSTPGTSGSSAPAWTVTTTSDGSVVWTNQGSMGSSTNSAARTEVGGTSGIIIDNTSTSAGASQIYFGTLGYNSSCGGHCAVQASQSGLSQ